MKTEKQPVTIKEEQMIIIRELMKTGKKTKDEVITLLLEIAIKHLGIR